MSKGLILLTSAVFFFYGLAFAIAPNSMLSQATGGYATSTSMLVDMRATYGGMSVGVALVLFLLSQKRQHIVQACWPSFLSMGVWRQGESSVWSAMVKPTVQCISI